VAAPPAGHAVVLLSSWRTLLWAAASTVGYLAAWWMGGLLLGPEIVGDWFAIGFVVTLLFGVIGAAVGAFQWLVAARGKIRPGRWIGAAALGFAAVHPWSFLFWVLVAPAGSLLLALQEVAAPDGWGNPPPATPAALLVQTIEFLPAGAAFALLQRWAAPRPSLAASAAIAGVVAAAQALGRVGGTKVHYTGYPNASLDPTTAPWYAEGIICLAVGALLFTLASTVGPLVRRRWAVG
jgi:hypothetical protein